MRITEYVIVFKDCNEFITEDKAEANKIFDENIDQVSQFYRKDWIRTDEEEWQEDYVYVYYTERGNL